MFRDIMIGLGFAGLEVILILLICWRVEIMAKRKILTPVTKIVKRSATTVHLPEVMNDNG